MQDGRFGFGGASAAPTDSSTIGQPLDPTRPVPPELQALVESARADEQEQYMQEPTEQQGFFRWAAGLAGKAGKATVNALRPSVLADAAIHLPESAGRLLQLGLRGVSKAEEEIANVAVGTGAEIVNKAIDLSGGPKTEVGENFKLWYEHRNEIASPGEMLTGGEGYRQRHLGAAPNTWYGEMFEGAAQLVSGITLTGGASEAGPILSAFRPGGLIHRVVSRAAGMALSTDWHVADVTNNASQVLPESTPRYITEGLETLTPDWLETTPDDNIIERRAKVFFEGLTMEWAAEGVVGLFKAIRNGANANVAAQAAKANNPADAAVEEIARAVERAENFRNNPTGPYRVEPRPDGRADLVIRETVPTKITVPGEMEARTALKAAGFTDEEGAKLARILADKSRQPGGTLDDRVAELAKLRDEGFNPAESPNFQRINAEAAKETERVTFNPQRVVPAFEGPNGKILFDPNLNTATHKGLAESQGIADPTNFRFGFVDPAKPDVFIPSIMDVSRGFVEKPRVGISREAALVAEADSRAARASGLRLREADKAPPVETGRVTFESEAEATQMGALLEELDSVQRQGPGVQGVDLEVWTETARAAETAFRAGDTDAIIRIINESPINLRYVHNNIEAKSALAALGKHVDLTQGPRPNEVTRALAKDLFPGADVETVIRGAQALRQSTESLPETMVALRGYVVGLSRATKKLAFQASSFEGPARVQAMDMLGQKLDELAELVYNVTGNSSNVGRALQSQKMAVGPRKFAGEAAKAVEEAKTASDAIKSAQEAARVAAESGDEAAIAVADKQLKSVIDRAQKLVAQEADSGLEGARAAEGVSSLNLPPGEPGPVPNAAEVTLSATERAEQLTGALQKFIQEEQARVQGVAAFENVSAPFAPTERLVFSQMSTNEIEAMADMIFRAGNDPVEVLQQIAVPSRKAVASSKLPFFYDPELTGWKKAVRAIQWYRVNAMLSGLKTNAINMTSNMLVATTRPIELMLGGIRTLDAGAVREGVDMYASMYHYIGDSWKMASRAFKSGESILTPSKSHLGFGVGELAQTWNQGFAGQMTSIFGMPGRTLMAADEFAAQLNYRAYLRSGLLREGRSRIASGRLAEDQLADFVETRMRFGFGQEEQATMAAARDYALTNTFKNDLGKYGQGFDNLIRENEVLSMLFPFRKTPLNIVNYAWDRTPGLELLRKNMRANLSGANGLRAQQEAYGQVWMGRMAYTTGAMLYMGGKLTGGGPAIGSPNYATWHAANDPYTLTVGEGEDAVKIDLKRLDPVLTPLSLIADLMEVTGELEDETVTEAAALLIVSVAGTMSDRTFFSNFAEAMEALTAQDGRKFQRLIGSQAGTFVPNLANQLNSDDVYRDARTWLDEIRKRVPGWSDEVEPVRNIFGAPVVRPPGVLNRGFNPLTLKFGDTMDEQLARELYEAGAYVATPSPILRFGAGDTAIAVDLRQRGKWLNEAEGRKPDQSPYDRWMELMASATFGGKTLRDRLLRKTETAEWRDTDARQRGNVMKLLISQHREVAKQMMLSEYPSLHNELLFSQTMAQISSQTTDEEALGRVREAFGLDERGTWTRLRNALGGE